MFAYALKRLLGSLPLLFLVSVLSFTLIKLSPGDALDTLRANPAVSQQFIQSEVDRLGLDRPPYEQYFIWLKNALQGDLGNSYTYQISAVSLVTQRAGNTLLMAIASFFFTWLVAIPLGIYGAVRQSSLADKILSFISYLSQGFPSFVLCIGLLFVASVSGGLLPTGGMTSVNYAQLNPFQQILDTAWHLILPTLAIGLVGFAGLQRITRGNLLDVLREDYIRTARAKGLDENRVIYVHALRNSVNTLITLLGFEFAGLLSGAFIAEFFFSWPGLGMLILEAFKSYDINVVMASLLLGTFMLVLGNLFADLLLKVADPRIRLEEAE